MVEINAVYIKKTRKSGCLSIGYPLTMFKIFRKNCCGLDVHNTWIYACIGVTNTNGHTEYKQARFLSFSKGLKDLADWLAKYSCIEVCMESADKYWISVFNILERACFVILAHLKYTKPQKGNKTDRKDAKWICDLFICAQLYPFPDIPIIHIFSFQRLHSITRCSRISILIKIR